MYCGQCGAQNDDGALFCSRCGARFNAAQGTHTEKRPKGQSVQVKLKAVWQKWKPILHKVRQRILKELLNANKAIFDYLSAPQPAKDASEDVLTRKISFYRVIIGFALLIFIISIPAAFASSRSGGVPVSGSSSQTQKGGVKKLSAAELAKVKELDAQVDANEINTMGNTFGNLACGGNVAEQGGWIYFTKSSGFYGYRFLYKSRLDGSDETQLTKKIVNGSINVLGDWIYYVGDCSIQNYNFYKNQEENTTKIWKIKTDGTGETLLKEYPYDVHAYFWVTMMVEGDVIYGCAGDRLFRMNTDGSGYSEYTAGNLESYGAPIYIDDTSIYFIGGKRYAELYCVKKDDSSISRVMLLDNSEHLCVTQYPNYSGGSLYWVQDINSVYGMKTGDTEAKLLDDTAFGYSLYLWDGWLYFANNDGLYKIRTDGTDKTLVAEGFNNTYTGNVFGEFNGWLYYINNSEALCRMRPDGTLVQEVSG